MDQNGEQTDSVFSKLKKRTRKADWHKMALYIALLLSVVWHVHSLALANETADAASELISKCAYW